MPKPYKMMYAGVLPEGLRRQLEEAVPGIEIVAVTTNEEALAHASTVDAVAGWGRFMGPEVLERATKLTWIQMLSAGVERIAPLLLAKQRLDIRLTNVRGAHAVPIAEHFLAMLLSLAHRLPEYARQQAGRQWQRLDMLEVRGECLLVLGLGHLGREIAALAEAVGVRVEAYDPYLSSPAAGVSRLYTEPAQLHGALGGARYVVSCVPMTPATRHLMGSAEFAAMPAGSLFFNMSRGGVVDEKALIAALQSGHLAGAGLDVFEVEPLPADSPLWAMPNVIITPHIAAQTKGTQQRLEAILVKNARRFALGQPLLNPVETERGF